MHINTPVPGSIKPCRANKETRIKMEDAIMSVTESTIFGQSVNPSGTRRCFAGVGYAHQSTLCSARAAKERAVLLHWGDLTTPLPPRDI